MPSSDLWSRIVEEKRGGRQMFGPFETDNPSVVIDAFKAKVDEVEKRAKTRLFGDCDLVWGRLRKDIELKPRAWFEFIPDGVSSSYKYIADGTYATLIWMRIHEKIRYAFTAFRSAVPHSGRAGEARYIHRTPEQYYTVLGMVDRADALIRRYLSVLGLMQPPQDITLCRVMDRATDYVIVQSLGLNTGYLCTQKYVLEFGPVRPTSRRLMPVLRSFIETEDIKINTKKRNWADKMLQLAILHKLENPNGHVRKLFQKEV
ncbi:MAG: hypothetical protein QXQ53_04440 [Candidatus Methanosuratincola sp.]